MNRREVLQAGLGILSAAGIDGEVATLSPRNPQAIVLTSSRPISQEAIKNLGDQWKRMFAGTALENVPVIVLHEGLTLQVIDKEEP